MINFVFLNFNLQQLLIGTSYVVHMRRGSGGHPPLDPTVFMQFKGELKEKFQPDCLQALVLRSKSGSGEIPSTPLSSPLPKIKKVEWSNPKYVISNNVPTLVSLTKRRRAIDIAHVGLHLTNYRAYPSCCIAEEHHTIFAIE